MIKSMHSRKDKLIIEKRHDVYQSRNKWPEFTRWHACKGELSLQYAEAGDIIRVQWQW